jgi:hypothetical protein
MRRIVLIASLLAFGLTLSACESMDPSEWFNTKKPLPGDRKAVFPEGVPGVPQGVPPDLVKGYEPPVEPVPEPRVVEEKPKPKPKPKPKKQAAAPRTMLTVAPPSQQQQQQQPAPAQSQAAFPDPPRR